MKKIKLGRVSICQTGGELIKAHSDAWVTASGRFICEPHNENPFLAAYNKFLMDNPNVEMMSYYQIFRAGYEAGKELVDES